MLLINVEYIVKPGMRKEFYDAIRSSRIAEKSEMEEGNIKYEYSLSEDNEDVLLLEEKWTCAESQKKHTQAEHFKILGELKAEYVSDTRLNFLNVRLAKADDIDRIFEIEKEAFPPAEAADRNTYEWRLENYPNCFFVGEADGRIVSVVDIIPWAKETITDEIFEPVKMPAGRNAAVISVMTAADYRNRGIAGMLLSFALDQMKTAGFSKSCLTCKESLIRYYSGFGYRNAGLSQSVHGDAVWYDMVKEL